MIGGRSRFAQWLGKAVPSREALERNRFLRPVSHHVLAPALWRFTRRSVPRGVALGLLVGILLMLPGVQMASAALLALPVRANVPVAVSMTLLSNPLTTPFILAVSYYVGAFLLGASADLGAFAALIDHHASLAEWARWLLSETAPVLLFGLFVVAVAASAMGYLLASWLWRDRIGRKWRRRGQGELLGGAP